MPNASFQYLLHIMAGLGQPSPDRLVVAPASAIKHSPHGGILLIDEHGKRHACQSVVTLLAHVGKCQMRESDGGARIMTTKPWNVPFSTTADETGAAEHSQTKPPHCDAELQSSFVSYCTTANVQFYTLSSSLGRDPVYALAVIAGAHKEGDRIVYMMDKVQRLQPSDVKNVREHCMKHWKLGCFGCFGFSVHTSIMGPSLGKACSPSLRNSHC